MINVQAYAALAPKSSLQQFEYKLPSLGSEQVRIEIESCGICHSDLSMLDNDWGMSSYPIVPGHEIIGRVIEVGDNAKRVKIGDHVGLGWFSGSCMSCHSCLSGNHNLCITAEQTIVNRHGGFASHIQAHWSWASPLPDLLDPQKAGPLFCGGITVFNPIIGDVKSRHLPVAIQSTRKQLKWELITH
jgi:alcohol/geraniol dehydrogenase (NADP+)